MIFYLFIMLLIILLFRSESFVNYEPQLWNNDKGIRLSHNCYQYALNDIDYNLKKDCDKDKNGCIKLRSRPGHFSKKKIYKDDKKLMTCNLMNKAIKDDNEKIYNIDFKNKCKNDFYKIAFSVDPGKTYHFYRQDDNGNWSHKDAGSHATNLDKSGNLIFDPKKADRGIYKKFCDYLCVPENNIVNTNYFRF
jgi:hypothetical protein